MKLRLFLFLCLSFFLHFNILNASDYNELDNRYIDTNGDLLADIPKDSKNWIDPSYLVFSYAPHESPNIYKNSWSDFIKYLSVITGKKVVYFPFRTQEAQLEAMRYGKLHVAGFSTGMVPNAVNYAGFHPFAIMADKNDTYGYRMEIITNLNSNIKDIKQLKGKMLTLTSPSSNSGYKFPIYLIEKDFNLKANKDYSIILSGSHSNSIKGIVNHQYDIVAVASSVKQRMINRKEVNSSDILTIYKSKQFPTTGYGYVYNLNPELINKIKIAFLTFPWVDKDNKPSSLKKEFKDKDKFLQIDYKETWKNIREISKKFQ